MSLGQCKGTTRKGTPCQMRPLGGSEWCFNHDPGQARQRAEARSKGGRGGKRGRPSELAGSFKIETPKDALHLLAIAANELLALESTVSRNRALVQVAVSSLRVFEVAALEERIACLEAVAEGFRVDDLLPPTTTAGRYRQ